jgi:exosortase
MCAGKTAVKRHWCVLFSVIVVSVLMVPPLTAFFKLSYRSDYYSHVSLVPLVSAYLLFQRRKLLLDDAKCEPRHGLPLVAGGLVLYLTGIFGRAGLSEHNAASLMIFSSLLVLFGAYVSVYGLSAFKRSAFPLLFLLFMVPIPDALMDRLIYFLQVGSAEVTGMIFQGIGIPHLRDGLVFQVPGFSIEIAKQCSGIRSSLALVITAFIAGHLFLSARWQKVVLLLSLVPMVLLKNGIRIVVLTVLGLYVDRRILTEGFLHKSGGIFFFLPILALMGVMLWLLRKADRPVDSRQQAAGSERKTAT